MDRRDFLRGSAAGLAGLATLTATGTAPLRAASLSPPSAAAAAPPSAGGSEPLAAPAPGRAGWLSGFGKDDGSFGLAWIAPDLAVQEVVTTPHRLHGFASHPSRTEICAPARRPGRAVRLWQDAAQDDQAGGAASAGRIWRQETPPGRHCGGHAAYTGDGTLLLLAENDYEGERGVIGLYEPTASGQRLGEVASGGVGPHEILPHPDGRHLIVANGGILTHPNTGRAKLNLATMRPRLCLLDPRNGAITAQTEPASEHHQLSLRHLAVTPRGTVLVGAQDQRRPLSGRPLVAVWDPGSAADRLRWLEAPMGGWQPLRGYVGSVAIDSSGRIAAATAPRGGVAVFWSLEDNRVLGQHHAIDVCGVAPAPAPGEFLLTSGLGQLVRLRVSAAGVILQQTARAPLRFDNHCNTV